MKQVKEDIEPAGINSITWSRVYFLFLGHAFRSPSKSRSSKIKLFGPLSCRLTFTEKHGSYY